MIPIAPNQSFTYVEQLGDPTDVGTNYVKMVVSYSSNSSIIATVNMTNRGGQRFTGTFTVPADITGQGYYIDIKTTVYSDSGYTTLNVNYPIVNNQFFVIQPITSASFGGQDGLDEGTMIKILEKMLSKHIGGMKFPKNEPVNFSPLTDKADMMLQLLIENQDNHRITHGKIDGMHANIGESLGTIPRKEFKETDIYPAIEGIQNVSAFIEKLEKAVNNHTKEVKEHYEKLISASEKKMLEALENKSIEITARIKDEMPNIPFNISLTPAREPKKEQSNEIDPRIKKLISPYA